MDKNCKFYKSESHENPFHSIKPFLPANLSVLYFRFSVIFSYRNNFINKKLENIVFSIYFVEVLFDLIRFVIPNTILLGILPGITFSIFFLCLRNYLSNNFYSLILLTYISRFFLIFKALPKLNIAKYYLGK